MNLRKIFGERYVVTLEETWNVLTGDNQDPLLDEDDDEAYQEIKGKRGMVYPYSDNEIAVQVMPRHARRLVKLLGAALTKLQHGDDLICYKADVKHAEAIVRFIKPKSVRRLTEAHKAALGFRLAAHRHKRWQNLVPTK